MQMVVLNVPDVAFKQEVLLPESRRSRELASKTIDVESEVHTGAPPVADFLHCFVCNLG